MSGSRKRKLEFAAQGDADEENSKFGAKRVTRSSKDKACIGSGGEQRSTPRRSTPRRRVSGSEGDILPPKLFKVEKIPKKGRLNSYSKPEYLQTISDALRGTEELEWLKTSQFGSLFQIPVHMCGLSGKLVHNLLCRQVLTRKKHELWFVFAGYPIRYSLREFAMLTGLNCDPFPRTSEGPALKKPEKRVDSFWKWLIGDVEECYVSRIVKLLQKDYHDGIGGKERMPAEKRLKLSLVVLVDGILLCDSSKIFVSLETVEKVKDVEAFARYPWGRRSFHLTLQKVKVGNKIGSVKELMQKFGQSHTSIHGFTLAFQLLALKCIPNLQNLLATRDKNASQFDHLVDKLETHKKMHNSTILRVEEATDVVVHTFLPEGFPVVVPDPAWDDEVPDPQVENVLTMISRGHKFSGQEWQYVEDNKALVDDIVDSIKTKAAGVKNVWKRLRRCKSAGKKPVRREQKDRDACLDPGTEQGVVGGVVPPSVLQKVITSMEKHMELALTKINIEFDAARNDLLKHKAAAAAFAKAEFKAAKDYAEMHIIGARYGKKNYGASTSVEKERNVSIGSRQHVNAETGDIGVAKSNEGSGNAVEGQSTSEKNQQISGDELQDIDNYVDDGVEEVGQNDGPGEEDEFERQWAEASDAAKELYTGGSRSVESIQEDSDEEGIDSIKMADNVPVECGVENVGKTFEDGGVLIPEDGGGLIPEKSVEDCSIRGYELKSNKDAVGLDLEDSNMVDHLGHQGLKQDDVQGGGVAEQLIESVEADGKMSQVVGIVGESLGINVEKMNTEGLDCDNEKEEKEVEVVPNIDMPDLGDSTLGQEHRVVTADHVEQTVRVREATVVDDATGAEAEAVKEASIHEGASGTAMTLRSARKRKPTSRFTPTGNVKKVKGAGSDAKFAMLQTRLTKSRKRNFFVNGQYVKPNFFRQLYTPKTHVNSEHMEVMLSQVWRKNSSTLLDKRSVVLDCWFSAFLCADHKQYKKNRKSEGSFNWHSLVRRYVQGDVSSRPGRTAWVVDVDTIYTPMNWDDKHWVGVVIDLISGTIEVLDPFISLTSDSKMQTRMKPMIETLPGVIADLVNLEAGYYRPPSSFTCVRPSSVSQNERTGDCGPLTVRLLELKALGMSLEGITDEDVNKLRIAYAVEVYETFEGKLC